jgi:hypothetical protein
VWILQARAARQRAQVEQRVELVAAQLVRALVPEPVTAVSLPQSEAWLPAE